MKKLILFLILTASCFWEVKAQTACADLVGTTGVSQENSLWGLIDVYHYDCLDDILLDPSCSVGAPDYHIRVAEFDLATGQWTKDYHSGWEGTTVPTSVRVSDYFPANEPTCGKIYAVGFVEGPTWNPADIRFFTINCTDIPLWETYACKENLHNDNTSIDIATDQLHLQDGTRVITGYTRAGSSDMRLFIERINPNGSIDKMQYPIQGDAVSNVQIILDEVNDEFILFFDTRVSNNRDVFLLRVTPSSLSPIAYESNIVDDIGNEYAMKMEDNLNGTYMLLVNQETSTTAKSAYLVYTQRLPGFAFTENHIQIGASSDIQAYDIIETALRIGLGCSSPNRAYLICGYVDNEAFLVGADCYGDVFPQANTFDVDGNSNTRDVAKRIDYDSNNDKFYIAGERKPFSSSGIPPTQISGIIWLGEFDIDVLSSSYNATANWISLYENSSSNTETVNDLSFSDEHLYLTGQTNVAELATPFFIQSRAKAYINKFDLSGDVIWSKNYYDITDSQTKINDIELVCGSVQAVGNCNDIASTGSPAVESPINRFIYKNKLTLDGLTANPDCVQDIGFSKTLVTPTINTINNNQINGQSFQSASFTTLDDPLACETICCSSLTPCCSSSDAVFCELTQFNTDIQVIDCYAHVSFPLADSCHYVTVDWGDGTTDGPKQIPANFGHNYPTGGLKTLCFDVVEIGIYGDTCYQKSYCEEIELTCPVDSSACPIPDSFTLRPGDAFVTCYSGGNGNSVVAGIKNVDEVEPFFSGMYNTDLSGLLTLSPDMFTKNQIGGEVFGTCIDIEGNIYVTASTLYGYNGVPFSGPNGYASIIKIDGNTMTIDPTFASNLNLSGVSTGDFVNLVGDGVVLNNTNWNSHAKEQIYSGLGNICYDENNGYLLVTNFEDGKIHRITKNGIYIDAYDPLLLPPFLPDDGMPGFAPLGERIWGIQTYFNSVSGNTEVFYGVWSEDRRVYGTVTPCNGVSGTNTVRKVEIDNITGNFVSDSPIANVPNVAGTLPIPFSSPVSDIAISEDGLKMVWATRSMPADINKILGVNVYSAHVSSFYYLERNCKTCPWSLPIVFNNGAAQAKNSAGGVDFGPRQAVPDVDTGSICDQMIWTTGDNILNSALAYGLCGFDIGEIFTTNPVDDNRKYVIDADNVVNSEKSFMGDIEVFKCDCIDCQISSTLRIDNQSDTCCYILDLSNVSVSSQAASIQIDITGPSGVFFDQASISSTFNLGPYNPTSITVDNSGSLLPNGNSSDYLKFCFGNTGALVSNQTFTIKYFDIIGNELVDCEQEFTTDCELPTTDRGCIDVTDISVECDSLNYGQFKFTYQVTNLTSSQVLDKLDFRIVNPTTGIILSASSNPIVAPIGPGQTSTDQCIDVYDVPPGPYPKQVDIIFSATGYHQSDSSAFCCHDRLDTLSIELPDCTNCIDIVDYNVYCDSIGNYYLDFCVANNSMPPFVADELDIAKLSSTPSYLGLSQYLWDNTTDPGDFPLTTGTFCDTVQIIGFNPPQAGDMIDLEFRFNNIAQDSCCAEREILSIVLPDCCENINGDFEDFTGIWDGTNTWINNNLTNWFVSHGTPTYTSSPILTSARGMWMWSADGRGEGVYTDYNFVAGNSYTLTYDLYRYNTSYPSSTFHVKLLNNGLNPYGGGASNFPAPSSTPQSISTQTWATNGTWTTITETFIASPAHTQVWFYPFLAANVPGTIQAAVLLDNVCIVDNGLASPMFCDPVIDLGTSTIPSGTIHAQNEVFSAGIIPAGTNVSLKAGQCIRLDSGFSSDAAADLEIIIEDCEPDVPD